MAWRLRGWLWNYIGFTAKESDSLLDNITHCVIIVIVRRIHSRSYLGLTAIVSEFTHIVEFILLDNFQRRPSLPAV